MTFAQAFTQLKNALKRTRISHNNRQQLGKKRLPITTTTKHVTIPTKTTPTTTTTGTRQLATDQRARILNNDKNGDNIYTIVMDGKISDLNDDMSMFGERPGEEENGRWLITFL